jgi:hypothetical protein
MEGKGRVWFNGIEGERSWRMKGKQGKGRGKGKRVDTAPFVSHCEVPTSQHHRTTAAPAWTIA